MSDPDGTKGTKLGQARRDDRAATESPLLVTAMSEVRTWSTTFHHLIDQSPGELKSAKAAFYLLFRGIDEIEDHDQLSDETKTHLLHAVAGALQTRNVRGQLDAIFAPYSTLLPSVSLRLAQWTELAPPSIGPRIIDSAAALADRMAAWSHCSWRIDDSDAFDHYLFSVAVTPALILCDIWAWWDGTQVDRQKMVSLGLGMQAANILEDQYEDSRRGVNFLPEGWTERELAAYAERELEIARTILGDVPSEVPASVWCRGMIRTSERRLSAAT